MGFWDLVKSALGVDFTGVSKPASSTPAGGGSPRTTSTATASSTTASTPRPPAATPAANPPAGPKLLGDDEFVVPAGADPKTFYLTTRTIGAVRDKYDPATGQMKREGMKYGRDYEVTGGVWTDEQGNTRFVSAQQLAEARAQENKARTANAAFAQEARRVAFSQDTIGGMSTLAGGYAATVRTPMSVAGQADLNRTTAVQDRRELGPSPMSRLNARPTSVVNHERQALQEFIQGREKAFESVPVLGLFFKGQNALQEKIVNPMRAQGGIVRGAGEVLGMASDLTLFLPATAVRTGAQISIAGQRALFAPEKFKEELGFGAEYTLKETGAQLKSDPLGTALSAGVIVGSAKVVPHIFKAESRAAAAVGKSIEATARKALDTPIGKTVKVEARIGKAVVVEAYKPSVWERVFGRPKLAAEELVSGMPKSLLEAGEYSRVTSQPRPVRVRAEVMQVSRISVVENVAARTARASVSEPKTTVRMKIPKNLEQVEVGAQGVGREVNQISDRFAIGKAGVSGRTRMQVRFAVEDQTRVSGARALGAAPETLAFRIRETAGMVRMGVSDRAGLMVGTFREELRFSSKGARFTRAFNDILERGGTDVFKLKVKEVVSYGRQLTGERGVVEFGRAKFSDRLTIEGIKAARRAGARQRALSMVRETFGTRGKGGKTVWKPEAVKELKETPRARNPQMDEAFTPEERAAFPKARETSNGRGMRQYQRELYDKPVSSEYAGKVLVRRLVKPPAPGSEPLLYPEATTRGRLAPSELGFGKTGGIRGISRPYSFSKEFDAIISRNVEKQERALKQDFSVISALANARAEAQAIRAGTLGRIGEGQRQTGKTAEALSDKLGERLAQLETFIDIPAQVTIPRIREPPVEVPPRIPPGEIPGWRMPPGWPGSRGGGGGGGGGEPGLAGIPGERRRRRKSVIEAEADLLSKEISFASFGRATTKKSRERTREFEIIGPVYFPTEELRGSFRRR